MNALQFIYEDTEINFLVNPGQENVMVNATEMAKAFGKRTDVFLKTQTTKEFILELERTLNGGRSESEQALNGARSDYKIIDNRGHMGIYFERRLALKFAAWLDVKFEVWVFSTIDNILFGHYKEHWEAHARQEMARQEMETLKVKILTDPTPELVATYFEAERSMNSAKYDKSRAIRNQMTLFDKLNESE